MCVLLHLDVFMNPGVCLSANVTGQDLRFCHMKPMGHRIEYFHLHTDTAKFPLTMDIVTVAD